MAVAWEKYIRQNGESTVNIFRQTEQIFANGELAKGYREPRNVHTCKMVCLHWNGTHILLNYTAP